MIDTFEKGEIVHVKCYISGGSTEEDSDALAYDMVGHNCKVARVTDSSLVYVYTPDEEAVFPFWPEELEKLK